MAIATVHLNQTNTAASGITLATTITSTTAGNCLIVFFCTDAQTGRSVHDITDNGTHTNTWFKLIGNGASGQDLEIWCSLNVPASITSVTVNLNGPLAGGQILVNINEFSGVARASATDQTTSSAGTNTSPITGSTSALTTSADLAIGAFTHTSTSAPSAGPTNSYTALTAVVGTGIRLDPAYRILTSSVATSTGWTIASATWAGVLATLTPSVGERVSQTVLQVAAIPSSNERVSQTVLQVAAIPSSNERVSQTVLQVAAIPSSNERVSQTVLQTVATPSYVNSIVASTNTSGGVAANNIILNLPVGTVQNNMELAVIGFSGDPGSVNITPPAGWSLVIYGPAISTHGAVAVYYKFAGGSEPSTYTFSWTGATQITSGGILTIQRPFLNNPIGTTAASGSTGGTINPLTVVLTPKINYSMIVEILAWNGSQTFTAPVGAWSTQWNNNNASGMSTALSARNWDTGITLQQTATLSGSPTEYTSVSIEILGLIVPPLYYYYSKHPTPRTIRAAGLTAITYSPFKAATTLYDKMKRIGFPIGVQTFIKNLATSVSLLVTLFKIINTTQTTAVSLITTLLKQITGTLTSTVISLTTVLTTGLVHAQSLIANPVNTIVTLIKSIGKILTSTTVSLSVIPLKQIGKILKSTTISLVTTLQKILNKFLTTNVNTILILSKKITKMLISSVVNLTAFLFVAHSLVFIADIVAVSSTLLKQIEKILSVVVNTISILSKQIGKILNVVISTISIIIKTITNILTTNITTISTLVKTILTILTTNIVTLVVTLSDTFALILKVIENLSITLSQNVFKIFITTVSLISNIIKSLPRTLIVMVSTLVTLIKNNTFTLRALIVNLTATLIAGPAVTRILTTTVNITTSVLKEIIFDMISRIVFTFSSVINNISVTLNTIISIAATPIKSIGKIVSTIITIISSLIGHSVPTLTLYMPLKKTLIIYCPIAGDRIGFNLYMDLDPEARSKVI